MPRWLIYALLASLLWGSNAVLVKLAISKDYYGLDVSRSNFFIGIGVLAVMTINDRITATPFSTSHLPVYAISLAIGIVWALGNIFALKAVEAGGNMSQAVPVWNTNTLVAVFLCLLIFKEIPAGSDLIRVIIGAVLITIGAILVS